MHRSSGVALDRVSPSAIVNAAPAGIEVGWSWVTFPELLEDPGVMPFA
jgi:hypothetical protein